MNDEMKITKTFSISLRQFNRLNELERKTGKNRSELAQEAIEDLFVKLDRPDEPINPIVAPTD